MNVVGVAWQHAVEQYTTRECGWGCNLAGVTVFRYSRINVTRRTGQTEKIALT